MDEQALLSLIERSRRGEPEAQDALVRSAQNRVYYHCKKMLKHEQDAQDATQDVLIAMLTNLDKLREPAAFWGWLNGITANRCRHLLSAPHKEWQIPEDEDGSSMLDDLETLDAQTLPAEALERAETRRMMTELVDALPPDQRMTVLFYYYDEMSVGQIAEAMSVSEGTVKSRLNYARKAIRRGVEEAERRGDIKLHSVSPLLLLLLFLRREAEIEGLSAAAAGAMAGRVAAAASGAASAAAGAGAGITAAGSGTGAVSAAASTAAVGKAVAGGLSAKLVAGVVAAAVVVSAGVGIPAAAKRRTAQPPVTEPPAAVETVAPTPAPTPKPTPIPTPAQSPEPTPEPEPEPVISEASGFRFGLIGDCEHPSTYSVVAGQVTVDHLSFTISDFSASCSAPDDDGFVEYTLSYLQTVRTVVTGSGFRDVKWTGSKFRWYDTYTGLRMDVNKAETASYLVEYAGRQYPIWITLDTKSLGGEVHSNFPQDVSTFYVKTYTVKAPEDYRGLALAINLVDAPEIDEEETSGFWDGDETEKAHTTFMRLLPESLPETVAEEADSAAPQ